MPATKRIRELPPDPLDAEYWRKRKNEGWRLVALEWETDAVYAKAEHSLQEDIPYGLRIADDCRHLVEDPQEREAMLLMMEAIVQDRNMSDAAAELNQRGFRTRNGSAWGPAAVFALLPRLIEVGPRIFSAEDWARRRKSLQKAV